MFASNMHQNEWFQVRFFKNFLGRGSPSPLLVFSQALPSVRASPSILISLRLRLGLRPRLRLEFSGASRPRFSDVSRPRFLDALRPRFGLRPQLPIGELGLAPKINSWIRPWSEVGHQMWEETNKRMFEGECFGKNFIFRILRNGILRNGILRN